MYRGKSFDRAFKDVEEDGMSLSCRSCRPAPHPSPHSVFCHQEPHTVVGVELSVKLLQLQEH